MPIVNEDRVRTARHPNRRILRPASRTARRRSPGTKGTALFDGEETIVS
jgi:hypothetical protein